MPTDLDDYVDKDDPTDGGGGYLEEYYDDEPVGSGYLEHDQVALLCSRNKKCHCLVNTD